MFLLFPFLRSLFPGLTFCFQVSHFACRAHTLPQRLTPHGQKCLGSPGWGECGCDQCFRGLCVSGMETFRNHWFLHLCRFRFVSGAHTLPQRLTLCCCAGHFVSGFPGLFQKHCGNTMFLRFRCSRVCFRGSHFVSGSHTLPQGDTS